MGEKLTKAQIDVLRKLSVVQSSAYRMRRSLSTLHALHRRGLASPQGGLGRVFSPQTSLWRITSDGLSALQSIQKDNRNG